MEALAAISLAGNILQFLETSSKVVSKAHNFKRSSDGELKENKDLRIIIEELDECISKLESEDEPDESLKKLISSCKDVGNELKSALQKIEGKSGKKTIWTSYYQALKSVWREDDIQQKQKRLEGLRSEIGFQLLASLRKSLGSLFSRLDSTNSGVSSAVLSISQLHTTQQRSFEQLRCQAKDTGDSVLKKLNDSGTAFSEIKTALTGLQEAVEKLQSRTQLVRMLPFVKPAAKEFIGTFHFRDMYDREEGIANAYAETFEWLLAGTANHSTGAYSESAQQKERQILRSSAAYLFQKLGIEPHSYNALLPQDARNPGPEQDLQTWLASGSGIFWLYGKPGSGKSTLMKAMMPESGKYSLSTEIMRATATSPETQPTGKKKKEGFRERMRSLLSNWAGEDDLLTANFFFYRAGSTLQRSHRGLLLSLLRQLLAQQPGLVDQVFTPKMQADAVTRLGECKDSDSTVWSLQELRDTFQRIAAVPNIRIYLHIDGIDEMYAEGDGIADILYEIAKNPRIKILVAGRWSGEFAATFRKYKHLELDEITKLDILVYTLGKLYKTWKNNECFWISPWQAYNIVEEITAAAEGVFLWVKIVVKSLIDGAKNYEDAQQLMIRLKEYPKSLDDLYTQLLFDIEKRYSSRAALWLSIVYQARSPAETACSSMMQATKFDLNEADSLSKLLDFVFDGKGYQLSGEGEIKDVEKEKGRLAKPFQEQVKRQCRHFFKFRPRNYGAAYQRIEFAHRTVLDFMAQKQIQDHLMSCLEPGQVPCISAFVGSLHSGEYFARQASPRLGVESSVSDILKFVHQVVYTWKRDGHRLAYYGLHQASYHLHHPRNPRPYSKAIRYVANTAGIIPFLLHFHGAPIDFICQYVTNLNVKTIADKDDILLFSMQKIKERPVEIEEGLQVTELTRRLLPILFPDSRLPKESRVFLRFLQSFCREARRIEDSRIEMKFRRKFRVKPEDFEYLLSVGADPNTMCGPVNVFCDEDGPELSALSLVHHVRTLRNSRSEEIELALKMHGGREHSKARGESPDAFIN